MGIAAVVFAKYVVALVAMIAADVSVAGDVPLAFGCGVSELNLVVCMVGTLLGSVVSDVVVEVLFSGSGSIVENPLPSLLPEEVAVKVSFVACAEEVSSVLTMVLTVISLISGVVPFVDVSVVLVPPSVGTVTVIGVVVVNSGCDVIWSLPVLLVVTSVVPFISIVTLAEHRLLLYDISRKNEHTLSLSAWHRVASLLNDFLVTILI